MHGARITRKSAGRGTLEEYRHLVGVEDQPYLRAAGDGEERYESTVGEEAGRISVGLLLLLNTYEGSTSEGRVCRAG